MADVEFGRRLVMLLREAGAPLTQKRLGAWLGVSGAMAWNYKNGEKLPSMTNALAMARKLNCSVEYLLTGRGEKRPGPEMTEFHEIFSLLGPHEKDAILAAMRALVGRSQNIQRPNLSEVGNHLLNLRQSG